MVGRRLICRIAAPPSGRRDSNPRPSPWQGDALPAEPRPHASPESPRAGPPDRSGVASELYPILAQPPTRNRSQAQKSVPRTLPADSIHSITPGQPPSLSRPAPTKTAPNSSLAPPRDPSTLAPPTQAPAASPVIRSPSRSPPPILPRLCRPCARRVGLSPTPATGRATCRLRHRHR